MEAKHATPKEIVIVDDCSTDGSDRVVAEIASSDSRVRLVRMPRNSGAASARNRGISESRGKYIQFVDADDLLSPGSLGQLLQLAIKSGSPLVRGGLAIFDDGDFDSLRPVDIPTMEVRTLFRTERQLWIPWWFQTYLFSRVFLRERKILFQDLVDGEDPVFLAECLVQAESVSMTPFIVYHYRLFANQVRDDAAFLRHAAMVRETFLSVEPRAWYEGYGRMLHNEIIPGRLRKSLDPRSAEIRERMLRLLTPPEEVPASGGALDRPSGTVSKRNARGI